MGNLSIGRNIADLRKQNGITQETLSEVISVTGQAVSKWESGGSPDVELLQPIADYFGVSIDRLFGRKVREYGDIEAELAESIINIDDMDARLLKVFDYSWIMEIAIMGRVVADDEKTVDDAANTYGQLQYSQMLLNRGITSLGIDKALRYFLIMPEPDEGWSMKLYFKDVYCKIFLLL